jgi:hypothetical protein
MLRRPEVKRVSKAITKDIIINIRLIDISVTSLKIMPMIFAKIELSAAYKCSYLFFKAIYYFC